MEMQEKIGALYDAIVSLESREQCQELFDDLCTRKEIEKMAENVNEIIAKARNAREARKNAENAA